MPFERWMEEALELAERCRAEVEPNPRVGALAIEGDRVVGRGWHEYWGGRHAEIVALDDARGRGAKPDTIVVTLEPCSSPAGVGGKKTPPCTEALCGAGIRRVVIGAVDPDPRHRGAGIEALEARGIEVVDGIMSSRVAAQNAPFRKWQGLDRPWTIAKWAMTIDGKTATPTGESRWVSGPEARKRAHLLRSRCDAVVVGFRTAIIDDPELTVRHVVGAQPIRIIVDPFAEIDDDSNLVRTARTIPTWLLANEDASALRTGHLQDLGVIVISVKPGEGGRRLHLLEAWRELRRRGLQRVLVEGGGGLVAQLLGWRCIDQIEVFVAPKILGGRLSPTGVGGEGRAFMAEALAVREMSATSCGKDLRITGFLE
ncbi:MAG: bifunctional diaminohydroxyphosphoribosylaminopyrimidine deaminase/5-amino-6-(5-phosphoribosylamino)uracil reductase RibD [Planctomycetota bacterium]